MSKESIFKSKQKVKVILSDKTIFEVPIAWLELSTTLREAIEGFFFSFLHQVVFVSLIFFFLLFYKQKKDRVSFIEDMTTFTEEIVLPIVDEKVDSLVFQKILQYLEYHTNNPKDFVKGDKKEENENMVLEETKTEKGTTKTDQNTVQKRQNLRSIDDIVDWDIEFTSKTYSEPLINGKKQPMTYKEECYLMYAANALAIEPLVHLMAKKFASKIKNKSEQEVAQAFEIHSYFESLTDEEKLIRDEEYKRIRQEEGWIDKEEEEKKPAPSTTTTENATKETQDQKEEEKNKDKMEEEKNKDEMEEEKNKDEMEEN